MSISLASGHGLILRYSLRLNDDDMSHYTNGTITTQGEGRLFSFDLKDDSGEIRVTAFNEECNRFFDLIEVGKVYTISRGTVKTANRKYSNVPNEYEMSLTRDSQVTEGNDNG